MRTLLPVFLLFMCTLVLTNATAQYSIQAKSENDSFYCEQLIARGHLLYKNEKNISGYLEALTAAQKTGNTFLLAKIYRKLAESQRPMRNARMLQYDSLHLQYARNTGNDSLHFQALHDIATDHLNANNVAKSYRFITEMETIDNWNSPEKEYALCHIKGKHIFKSLQFEKAVRQFSQSLRLALALNNEDKIYDSRLWCGISSIFANKLDSALDYLFDVIDYGKKNKRLSLLEAAYSFLAFGYKKNGNLDKAAAYYELAHPICVTSGNKVLEAETLNNLGEIAHLQKQYDKAGSLIRKSLILHQQSGYRFGEAFSLVNQANLLVELDKMDSAKSSLDRAWAIALELQNETIKLKVQFARMLAETKLGNEQKASALLDTSVKLFQNIASDELKEQSVDKAEEGGLFNPDQSETIKNYLISPGNKAPDSTFSFNAFTAAAPLYDSLFSTRYNNKLLELETQYQTRLKDDSLRIQKQENIISIKKIQQRNLWLGMIALLVLLLLTAGLYQYSARQKERKKKSEIRLLKDEADHRVKNILNNIAAIIRQAKSRTRDISSITMLEERVEPLMILYRMLGENHTGEIALQDYLESICKNLQASYGVEKNIRLDINAPVTIAGSKAGKIGFIVNELVTNSFKHAFPDTDEGTIKISCTRGDDNSYHLAVSDSGKGIQENSSKGKGLTQVKALANELSATINQKTEEGAIFEFYFM